MELTEYELGQLLTYEQPTAYIVESTEYKDNYKTPVLTAGKSFVLGYTNETENIFDKLPVIIFDDFTTATQYVNFKFKVKSSAMKILHINSELVNPKYIYYRMQIIQFDHSTHKRYWIQQYSKLKVHIPPLAEQERIVAKIEELFSDLENAVETLNATKAQLEVYRQAVLKEAFEGKLTAKWRERNNIDYSFNKVNIKELVKKEKNSLKAGPFGSSLKKEFYVSNGYKIYGQEQVIAGDECIGDYYVNEEKYQELITCKVSPRDVLISLVGTVGKVLILSRECKAGLINPRLIKISLDENIMIPEYFKYYFESDFIKTLYKSKVHGATMDVLNMSMIKELPFLLCSIKEQEQIIYEIESRMSEYYNIENTVNMVLQQATAMRQSILKQAFEGRLL